MVEVDQEILEKALNALNKTKELICFAIQLTDAVQRGAIRPDQFKKKARVMESGSDDWFDIDLDWKQPPGRFQKVVYDIQACIINYMSILCKESYTKNLWVDKQQNEDLYAAQMIQKFIRDARAHMGEDRASTKKRAVPVWDIKEKCRKERFEIKELGIVFNAENLHGEPFDFSPLGGFVNYLKILDYLIKDLKEQLSAAAKKRASGKKF